MRSNVSKGSKNKETASGKSTNSHYDWLKFALHGIGLASTTTDPTNKVHCSFSSHLSQINHYYTLAAAKIQVQH